MEGCYGSHPKCEAGAVHDLEVQNHEELDGPRCRGPVGGLRRGEPMALIELEIEIKAPPALCFDLARDVDLHQRSMKESGEEAVGGRTTGLLELGEQVTWRARHFGVIHLHTAKITAFEKPSHFRDEMVSGRFASFVHDHYFARSGDGTRMRDVVEFRSPLGPLGAIVDALVLKPYLERLIQERNLTIRAEAERRTDSNPPATQAAAAGPPCGSLQEP